MLYLIMECYALGDQYECDADRTPLALTEDWKDYYQKNKKNLSDFEVYQWDGKEFERIKYYEDCMEKGMALSYMTEEENEKGTWDTEGYIPHIVTKWENKTRNDDVPDEVLTLINERDKEYWENEDELKIDCLDDSLSCSGTITWIDKNGNYWIYGEYRDNHYSLGF